MYDLESLSFVGPNYFDVRINGAAFDKTRLLGYKHPG
jgi:hypothetical protein